MSANEKQISNEDVAIQTSKPKPAAKSIVTLEIKPWGTSVPQSYGHLCSLSLLTCARRRHDGYA